MGTMTLEQAARREKRRAKEATRRAARAAAYTALILAAGGSVSSHTRLSLATWEADPARDVREFERAKFQIHCRWHSVYSAGAKRFLKRVLNSPQIMGELRQT